MAKDVFTQHRPQWKTHIGFLLAAIGSAVGLGNIWRFPYLCYKNGGGAFLVPYFIALLVVGIPLMILEIGLGHKMRGSAPASIAVISQKWEWAGWWQVILGMFGILLYYSVVISWCFNYFFFAFNGQWGADPNTFFFKQFLMVSNGPFEIGDLRTPILVGLMLVWFFNWLIVFVGVQKGLERANKIFMPLLFILTALIVFWGIRLPGASEGIKLYLKPQFSRLADIRVWMDAFSQIFFSLSLGFGVILAYASYLPRKSQIVRDAVIISFVNCLFSVFAGFGVFSVLGYMAHNTGQAISEVVTESIGLAFVVYPKAISMLPAFSREFGLVFFAILVIAGLSSGISILEGITSAIIDKFHYSRKVVVSVLSIIGFLGGIIFTTRAGILWLDIVDHFVTNYGIIIAAILECIIIGWIFKAKKLREHINHFSSWNLNKWWWDISVKVIAPVILGGLLISTILEEIARPYGGYTRLALLVIGRDWIVFTVFLAILVSASSWKVEPKQRIIEHSDK
ncbi:MAG: sodium-dependent transporter [Candidatus Omnitrophica bacterium]|nr:sodium-dependent transporter [Candidatus Omnitrophota bacterium]